MNTNNLKNFSVIATLCLILIGTGCTLSKQGPLFGVIPDGYSEDGLDELRFVFPTGMTVTKNEWSWDSNIMVWHKTHDELEKKCWEDYGERGYASTPSEKPTKQKLITLAEEGVTFENQSDYLGTQRGIDVFNCGWNRHSFRIFPYEIDGYKGMISWVCLSDSGCFTPSSFYTEVLLTNETDHYAVLLNYNFGVLDNQDVSHWWSDADYAVAGEALDYFGRTGLVDEDAVGPAYFVSGMASNQKAINEIIRSLSISN